MSRLASTKVNDCVRNIALKVDKLTKRFPRKGEDLLVLDKLSFDIRKGEFLSIVGPSGCGKTTLLEIAAGLQRPSSGNILHDNQEGDGNGLHSHLTLIVFQQYNRSMFPFLTVSKNVQFTLDAMPHINQKNKADRVKEALSITGLSAFSDYYPWELSGGMQQRVAFARAIAARPRVLLLDEPFGSLDTQTQYNLEDELLALVKRFKLTVVYVTHDIDSAIYCGHRLILLSLPPTHLVTDFDSDIPSPRNQIETRKNPRFLEYRERLYSLLKNEIEQSTASR